MACSSNSRIGPSAVSQSRNESGSKKATCNFDTSQIAWGAGDFLEGNKKESVLSTRKACRERQRWTYVPLVRSLFQKEEQIWMQPLKKKKKVGLPPLPELHFSDIFCQLRSAEISCLPHSAFCRSKGSRYQYSLWRSDSSSRTIQLPAAPPSSLSN